MLIQMQRCSNMRESMRASHEAPESRRTRNDLLWSAALWTSRQTLAFNTREKHWDETHRQHCGLQDRRASEAPADLTQIQHHHAVPQDRAAQRFHGNEGRDIKDAMTLTLNYFTSKRVSVVTVQWTDSRRDVSILCSVKSHNCLILFYGFRKTPSCLKTILFISEEIKEKNRWERRRKTEALSREGHKSYGAFRGLSGC